MMAATSGSDSRRDFSSICGRKCQYTFELLIAGSGKREAGSGIALTSLWVAGRAYSGVRGAIVAVVYVIPKKLEEKKKVWIEGEDEKKISAMEEEKSPEDGKKNLGAR